jgi:hypothetical protein
MPTKDSAPDPGSTKRLSVSWSWDGRDVTVTVDGRILGSFSDQSALKEGGTFDLPDGSKLEVKLAATAPVGALQVKWTDAPAPAAASDAETRAEAPTAGPLPSAAEAPAQTGAPAAAPAAPVAAPVRTLTGEAEKRRLQMTERVGSAPSAASSGVAGAKTSMENVAQALRFTAHKCEITDAGLRVTFGPGRAPREVAWADIGRLVVRQLPPDQPWNAAVLLDIVALLDGTKWEPIRVFATTFVNYGVLPGGASTSRLENIRKLTRHLRDKNPAAQVDPETTTFMEGTAVPSRFANMTQFAEYDSHYH